MSQPPAIETKLTRLAEQLLDDAITGQESVDAVDVFKAVSTWQLAMKKAAGKDAPDPSGSFAAIRSALTQKPANKEELQ
jgi:hypothetical protein